MEHVDIICTHYLSGLGGKGVPKKNPLTLLAAPVVVLVFALLL